MSRIVNVSGLTLTVGGTSLGTVTGLEFGDASEFPAEALEARSVSVSFRSEFVGDVRDVWFLLWRLRRIERRKKRRSLSRKRIGRTRRVVFGLTFLEVLEADLNRFFERAAVPEPTNSGSRPLEA